MAAVWYRFRAELRGRWPALVALALVAGIAGAATLAAIAGARRTDTAFARMLAATRAPDVLVNPDFGNDSNLDVDAVRHLPMVEDAAVGRGLIVAPLPVHGVADLDATLTLGQVDAASSRIALANVQHGRLPDPSAPDEAIVNQRFADHYGLHVADTFPVIAISQQDVADFEAGGASPKEIFRRLNQGRSEERRVGKEGRTGVVAEH